MPAHDLIVVGASAGGLEALQMLVAGLSVNLPAAVCIVLHLPPDHRSRLPEILSRAGPLPAAHGVDGAPITPGRIYVAPPDHPSWSRPGISGSPVGRKKTARAPRWTPCSARPPMPMGRG